MFFKNKKLNKDQELKVDLLIDSGYKVLDLHNKIYDTLNKKIMWFFTVLSAIEGYLLINFFFSRNFMDHNIYIISLFIFIILIGLILLGYYLYLLKLKSFDTGPDTVKQTTNFWNEDKDVFSLKSDLLGTLNQSYTNNDKVIKELSKKFSKSLLFLGFYLILIVIYFLIITFMSEDNKNNNIPVTSDNTASQQYGEPPLTSSNTGKIDKTYNPEISK